MNKNLKNLQRKGRVRKVLGNAGVQKYSANNFRAPGVSYEQLVHLTGPIKSRQSPQARTNNSAAINRNSVESFKEMIRHQAETLKKLEGNFVRLAKLIESQEAIKAEALKKSRPPGPRVRKDPWLG